MKKITPIIKVVGDSCNLRCGYCFYSTKDQLTSHVMSDELLEKCISEIIKFSNNKIIFIWHGGEPLLAGKDFFRNAVALQKKHKREDQEIRNSIQTNATLVDNEWAKFFKDNNFRVGISLDGDKLSHDVFRKNSAGKGSFEKTFQGINVLRSHGIEPGIIQTITKDNISRCAENFSFFANTLRLKNWGINPFFGRVSFNEQMKNQGVLNEELAGFLKKCFDMWLHRGDPKLRIREIDNFLTGIFGKRAKLCIFNGNCASYICIDYDGKIYPCDRFSGRDDLLFGDLSKQPLEEVLQSDVRVNYARCVNVPHPDCAVCEWKLMCHNGCTHHRPDGVNGKYYYCAARKEFFAYLKEKLNVVFENGDVPKILKKGGESGGLFIRERNAGRCCD